MTRKEAIEVAKMARTDGWVFACYRRIGTIYGVDLVDPVTGYTVHHWNKGDYEERMARIRFDRDHLDYAV